MFTTEFCQTTLNALACDAGLNAFGGPAVLLGLALPSAGSLVWSLAHVPPRPFDAHYASDVLAGYASGAAWLLLCILVIEHLRDASSQPANLGTTRSRSSSTAPT